MAVMLSVSDSWQLLQKTDRDHLDTLLRQCLSIGLTGITTDATNLPFGSSLGVRFDRLDDRSALLARSTKDNENL